MASLLAWPDSRPVDPPPTKALSPTEPPEPTLAPVAVQFGGVWRLPLTLAFCTTSALLFVSRVDTSPWSIRLGAFHTPPGKRARLVDWKLSVLTLNPLKSTVVEATMAP